MKYINKNLLLGLFGTLAFIACDDIDEADRITEGKMEHHAMMEEEVTLEVDGQSFTYIDRHTLLIEDFTGWRCVNCPNMANFLLNNIERIYPSVVVSLHPAANSLSNTDSDKIPFNLSCTLADDIANTLAGSSVASSMSLPAVSIDQKAYDGQILQSGDTTTVYNILRAIAFDQYNSYNIERKPYINLAINVEKLSTGNYQLSTLIVPGIYSNKNLLLQLWLLESGIEAYQSTQTGIDRNYINNHVLRMAINGNQGETVTMTGENIVKKYTLSLDGTGYVADNCSVVAIVCDPSTHEVINCIEIEL
jgi:hypothetical protein